tara:strand:+ start:409 stop:570 length:162 start_codon:yes stop_codon:yes gene_type:complete
MIRSIVDLLKSNDFYNVEDDDIQFAKGAYDLPTSFSKLKNYRKRQKALRNGRK